MDQLLIRNDKIECQDCSGLYSIPNYIYKKTALWNDLYKKFRDFDENMSSAIS